MSFAILQPWLYTLCLGLLGLLIIGSNLRYCLQARRHHEATSLALFIGSVFGIPAFLLAPMPELRWLAFVPPLIDPGTNFILVRHYKSERERG